MEQGKSRGARRIVAVFQRSDASLTVSAEHNIRFFPFFNVVVPDQGPICFPSVPSVRHQIELSNE